MLRIKRKLTLQNIQFSFPNLTNSQCKKLARNNYKSTCMVIAEAIKGLTLNKAQIKKRVTFKNLEILEKYLVKDQSVIIATAHVCNFEWALLACALYIDYPVDIIYRTQRTAWLEKVFFNLRSRFGITPLPMDTCVAESLKRAKITRVIAMAADQSPKRNDTPYWQSFLNRDTPFHTGTEKIAKAFKYPIVFMSLKRTRLGFYEASFKLLDEPPYSSEPNIIMKKYIKELEALILTSPKDWLWAYRRWKITKTVYA